MPERQNNPQMPCNHIDPQHPQSSIGLIHTTNGFTVIVDSDLVPYLNRFAWTAVRRRRTWYAKTLVGTPEKPYWLSMHRLINKPPPGQVVHHINRDGLDNRRSNLLNMDKHHHHLLHKTNGALIVYRAHTPSHTPRHPCTL